MKTGYKNINDHNMPCISIIIIMYDNIYRNTDKMTNCTGFICLLDQAIDLQEAPDSYAASDNKYKT